MHGCSICPRKGSVWGLSPAGPSLLSLASGVVYPRAGPRGSLVGIQAATFPATKRVKIVRTLHLLGMTLAMAAAFGCQGVQSGPEASGPNGTRPVRPWEGIVVLRDDAAVEIEAWACLEAGWLEQVACSPQTREHESLIVIEAEPSQIHAALLLAGLEPGAPGRWTYEDEVFSVVPPSGDRLDILVRYQRDGRTVEEPIERWIRDRRGNHEFPDDSWVFAGSSLAPNPEWMGEGEHYVADLTGSIIGLVTFGDEVIGFSRVVSDQEAISPSEWEVKSDHVPPVGTRVTLILRRAEGWESASGRSDGPK